MDLYNHTPILLMQKGEARFVNDNMSAANETADRKCAKECDNTITIKEENVDNDVEYADMVLNCGICGEEFTSLSKVQKHRLICNETILEENDSNNMCTEGSKYMNTCGNTGTNNNESADIADKYGLSKVHRYKAVRDETANCDEASKDKHSSLNSQKSPMASVLYKWNVSDVLELNQNAKQTLSLAWSRLKKLRVRLTAGHDHANYDENDVNNSNQDANKKLLSEMTELRQLITRLIAEHDHSYNIKEMCTVDKLMVEVRKQVIIGKAPTEENVEELLDITLKCGACGEHICYEPVLRYSGMAYIDIPGEEHDAVECEYTEDCDDTCIQRDGNVDKDTIKSPDLATVEVGSGMCWEDLKNIPETQQQRAIATGDETLMKKRRLIVEQDHSYHLNISSTAMMKLLKNTALSTYRDVQLLACSIRKAQYMHYSNTVRMGP